MKDRWSLAAAKNEITDRMFKHYGCWTSEIAIDSYVKDNLKECLSVSLSLGL